MKKLMVFAIVIISCSFFSCQKEEDALSPAIVKNDTPPSQLSLNTYECWLEKSDFLNAEELQYGSNYRYDQNGDFIGYYESGMWRLIRARKYFGSVNGVFYVSQSTDYYVVSEEAFNSGRNLIDKMGMIKGYFDKGQNPLGRNNFKISNFEEI